MARPMDKARAREHAEWLRGIERALIKARRDALEEGRAKGVPIVYMKDGRIVEDDGRDDD